MVSSFDNIGLYVQRQMVQTVINLANGYQGGSWQLISVTERATHTELLFELDRPLVGKLQQVNKVRVYIEPEVSKREE
jgi:hypothetical protein